MPRDRWWITRQCERCRTPVDDRELRLTRRILGFNVRLHVGCLGPLEQRMLMRSQAGLVCLFCARQGFTMRELIDHFQERHGRVIA